MPTSSRYLSAQHAKDEPHTVSAAHAEALAASVRALGHREEAAGRAIERPDEVSLFWVGQQPVQSALYAVVAALQQRNTQSEAHLVERL